VLFKIPNTNTLLTETNTRVKQLNEFNAVKCYPTEEKILILS